MMFPIIFLVTQAGRMRANWRGQGNGTGRLDVPSARCRKGSCLSFSRVGSHCAGRGAEYCASK